MIVVWKMILYEQGRIHGSISRKRWAGALMEVRSLFGLNSAIRKKTRNGRTDGPTDGRKDGWTDPNIESLVRD